MSRTEAVGAQHRESAQRDVENEIQHDPDPVVRLDLVQVKDPVEAEPSAAPFAPRAPAPDPGPPPAKRGRRRLAPAVAVTMLALLIAAFAWAGTDGPSQPASAPRPAASQPVATDPPTPDVPAVEVDPPTTPKLFIARLRDLDPVYADRPGPALSAAGRRSCLDYRNGQDVVQIIATLGSGSGSGDGLDPAQAATFLRLSGPTFCPQFVKPMGEELDGLQS